jgi:membrane protein implicated in regulation of membrane protease activity
MKFAIMVVALFAFVAGFVLDTEAVVRMAFSWAPGGLTYRWMLPSTAVVVVAWICWRRSSRRVVTRKRVVRSAVRRKGRVAEQRRPNRRGQVVVAKGR